MRQFSKYFGTGCFFLCLGGWVWGTQASLADSVNGGRESALNAAVAEAVNATQSTPATETTAEGAGPVVTTAETGARSILEQPVLVTPMSGDVVKAPQQESPPVVVVSPEPITPEPVTPEPVTQVEPSSPELEIVSPEVEPTVAAGSESEPAAPEAAKPAKGAEATNLNAGAVNVGVDGTVETFSVQDLDINTALHFLSLQAHKNIIASKNVKGTVTVNLYNVTFAEALHALLEPNGFGYIEKGNFIYVYTVEEMAIEREKNRKVESRVFRLNYLSAADASILVKPMLSERAVVALTAPPGVGLPREASDTGGNGYATDDALVINDYAENLADVALKLRELDIRPKQVLVEATILNATLSDTNALGVDILSMSGIDFPTIGSVISPLVGQTESSDSKFERTVDNVRTPGQLAGHLNPFYGTQGTVGTDFAGSVPNGGLTLGLLSNHISMFVRALESVTNVSVVANPKVLTLNKHRGTVLVGRQLGYMTTTTSTTTSEQTVSFIDVGTKLVFRPFIGDNGYVRMEIRPEDSGGSIDDKGIPHKSTAEVTTNVNVKDGRTVVIGGLFRESTTAGRGQVPILGNIPIIGSMFRQTSDDIQRQEMIVLITPHIMSD
ncbi:MAG: secretin and TonB N-terminal domain-containing protein, partial [Phycisphaerales bacterium]|nr:secretin and TonB N-terminal domain-containing protein [Phycisphaerales bacterium]